MVMMLRTLLVLLLFACSTGQRPSLERIDNHSASMKYTPLSEDHWLSRASISEFANLPWNSKQGLTATKMPDALGAFANPNQVVWPSVSLLPAAEGKLLVKGSSEVLGINADGDLGSRYQLPEGGTEVWAMTAEGDLLVAQQLLNQKPALIKISRASKQVWNRQGDEYAMSQLIAQGDEVYLVRKGKAESEIYPVDTKTGDVGKSSAILPTIQSVFAGAENKLCYLTYDPQEKARFWNCKAEGEKPEQTRIPSELYGSFAKPIAADARSNAYGAFGSKLSRVNRDGSTGFTMEFEGIASGADGEHFFSHYDSETSTLLMLKKEKSGAAASTEIVIPDWIVKAHNKSAWKVVKVEGGKYHLLGRDPQAYIWNYLVYDARIGSFVVEKQPGDLTDLGDFVSAAGTWGVMENGNIILPVRTAKALQLLRVAI